MEEEKIGQSNFVKSFVGGHPIDLVLDQDETREFLEIYSSLEKEYVDYEGTGKYLTAISLTENGIMEFLNKIGVFGSANRTDTVWTASYEFHKFFVDEKFGIMVDLT